eukprot:Gb_26867 [translate_table: standard]
MESRAGEVDNDLPLDTQDTHLPCPPSSEHFEISTTVDPSYIIHLIRQLLPQSVGLRHDAQKDKNNASLSRDDDSSQKQQAKFSRIANGNLEAAINDSDAPGSSSHQSVVPQEILSDKENDRRKMQAEDGHAPLAEVVQFVGDEGKNVQIKLEVIENLQDDTEHAEPKAQEDQGEEAGCVLWDLAANPAHAEFMVENHLLDVLLTMLSVSISDRMREICLGIMGNLACHAVPERAMVGKNGLVQMVVQQLFLDDFPSLSETCRLLSAGLHSEEAVSWAEALEPELILQRIMWVAANTMNSQLLEKSTELLLAMVDSRKEAALTLLPPLVHLGLPELLTDLLTCEITAITEGTPAHGDAVLDTILQIGEALSLADEYSAELASNKKLFGLACKVIRLSGKDEVGPPGITAAVLVANLLTEQEKLIDEILHDANFVQNLLELLPSASDDPGARNALWSVLGRMFGNLTTSQEAQAGRRELVSVLANKSDLIVEDLDDHREEDTAEDDKNPSSEQANSPSFNKGLKAKIATVSKIVHILDDWIKLEEESSVQDLDGPVREASELLKYSIADKSSMDPTESTK